MAHTYTQQDGTRQSFEHLGDFLGEVVRRCTRQDVRLPVIIDATVDGLHIAELVPVLPEEILPPMPVGIGGGLRLIGG